MIGTYTEESIKDELQAILSDRVRRIETFLLIEDKAKRLVPFILNPIQRDMLETETTRDVYVKPGQVGASSVIVADYLFDCITVPGTVSVIVSYEEFITQRLLLKAQAFYDTLYDRIPSIPKVNHKSSNLKTFDFPKGAPSSSFYIGSARAYTFGRGENIHNLLADEYAFWDPSSIARIMAPIMKRVSAMSGGRIKILSTPNGDENDFFEVYSAAKEGYEIGESVFKAHFYHWMMHPEYSMSYDNKCALPRDRKPVLDDITPDEEKLIRLYGVSMDQIRWRRYSIVELQSLRRSGETRILHSQEFPEDDVNCFLVAGDMAYDSDLINEKAKGCYPAPQTDRGLHIWFPPEKDLRYIVSIDPGVAKESETVTTVWHFYRDGDIDKGKHCASLGGLILPEEAGKRGIEIARYYNNAMITWDFASQGWGVTSALKNYGNIYRRRDLYSGKIGNEIGWLTSPTAKRYMYTQMVSMLPHLEIYDNKIISQLRNMRWDETKKRLYPSGMDDYHDSTAMAVCCRESVPVTKGLVGQAGWKW